MAEGGKRFGVGIRGAGQVAYEHLNAIERNPHLYLAAVSSRSMESARALAAKAGGTEKGGDVRVYDAYEKMLEDDRVDIVSICMPNYLHAREAIAAFRAGKHLILEKPPAINEEELAGLREAAAAAKTASVVSFVLRWHPMISELKSVLDRGGIGSIYYAEADYWHGIKSTFASYPWIRKKEYAGGAMITGGCHAADILRYLTGQEAQEVFAYRTGTRDDFDYPTTLVAAVRFSGGMVGKLSASLDGLAFPYQLNIDLLGTAGAIRDNRVCSPSLFPEEKGFVSVSEETPNSGSVAHHPFQQEIDNLVDHLLEGKPILSDVSDACNSIAISLAVEKSAGTGKPVAVDVRPRQEGRDG